MLRSKTSSSNVSVHLLPSTDIKEASKSRWKQSVVPPFQGVTQWMMTIKQFPLVASARSYSHTIDFELIPTVKMETRHPIPYRDHCLSNALDRPSNQFFRLSVSQSVCVSVNRSVVERLRPQFFTDFHEILHAAQKCGRFVAYCLWKKREVVCQF